MAKTDSAGSAHSIQSIPAFQPSAPAPLPSPTTDRPLSDWTTPEPVPPPVIAQPQPRPLPPPSSSQPPFISHGHSASLPPPRHRSPPPISTKPASLSTASTSARMAASNKPAPPPVPSSIQEELSEEPDADSSFSNHFPSITEFESQPLPPLSPSTIQTPTAASSLEDRFANLLPSVPSNVPGSPLPMPTSSRSLLPPPLASATASDFQPFITTTPASPSDTPTPTNNNQPHPSPPTSNLMFGQQNSASTPNLAALNNASFSPSISPNNTLPAQNSGGSVASIGGVARDLPQPPHASKPKQKVDFPFSNTIFPSVLRRYIDAGASLLLLDVRPEDVFARGDAKTAASRAGSDVQSVDLVRVDPALLAEYGLNSAKLLKLLPPASQPIFSARSKCDLVVVYDNSSSTTSSSATAANTLTSIIFDREFSSATLKRAPVFMLGGFDAFAAEMKRPPGGGGSPNMGGPADGAANLARSPRMPVDGFHSASPPTFNGSATNGTASTSPASHPDLISLNRPTPIATSFPASYTYPSPPQPAASHPSSSRYPIASGSSSSHPQALTSPPPASISFSPLSRRRSDYADQASQSYSGYQAPSGHSSRPSIQYPTLLKEDPDGPKMPEQAATPTLERHASARSGTLVRSASGLSREGGPSGGDKGEEIRYWGEEIVGTSGLKNLGNTCYQNSTLQCLSATVPFTTFFRDGRWRRSVNMNNPFGTKGNLASAYSSLVSALWNQEYHFIQPLSFRKSIVKFAPAFDGNEQHDSQEFLAFLLDGLHEDLNRVQVRPPAKEVTPEREHELNTLPPQIASSQEWKAYQQRNDSLVVDWFQGQYRSKVECQTCRAHSISYDAFMYLSLPVPTGRFSKGKCSLEQCLDGFVKEEMMEGDNAWNCPKCKKARTATKSLSLSRLPPVLLIHLKRFSSKNGVFWDKAETLVEFPVRSLDLTKYLPPPLPSSGPDSHAAQMKKAEDPRDQSGPFVYELYGVSNHSGSLSGGHYTAFVKSARRHWKYCDDRTISEADEKDLVSKNAYILFYRRVPVKRSAL